MTQTTENQVNKFNLITIGDATIDTFIRIHDAAVQCDINHEVCKICVSYGDKIPVDSISHSVAGNAANTAIGAATLGLKTAIYTNLGEDEEGKLIKKTLEEKGVDSRFIKIDKIKSSNLSVILTFQGERTAFVYHQPWFYHLPNLDKTDWLYFTSIAETFTNSNIVDEVCHYIDNTGAKLAFSPGTFQIKANIKRFPKLLERCELLVLNLEEAKKVLEIDMAKTVEPHDLLAQLLLLGPKNIVVTDSEEGSYATNGSNNYKLGIFPVQVVEKTGAGDAYTSAFISALFYGLNMEEAMVWGTINASQVISKSGPLGGLMNREEIERYRKAVPEFKTVALS